MTYILYRWEALGETLRTGPFTLMVKNGGRKHAEEFMKEYIISKRNQLIQCRGLTKSAILQFPNGTCSSTTISESIEKIELIMYMNYSQCSGCSASLLNFICNCLEIGIIVNIKIVAAAPYRCIRPSCNPCSPITTYQSPSGFKVTTSLDADKNTQGLINLIQNGVSLRGFEWPDWQFLAVQLSINLTFNLK